MTLKNTPSKSLLRELEAAVSGAPYEVKAVVKKHATTLLLLLYPEWANDLMGAIFIEEGKTKFDPAEYLSMTPDEQENFLKKMVGIKPTKRRVN